MRIGFDSKRLFANHTGLGNYSRRVVKNLVNHFPHDEYYLFSPIKKSRYSDDDYLHKCNVVYPKGGLTSAYRSYFVAKDIKSAGLDIFHGLSHEIPFSKNLGCKRVVTIHDVIFRKFPEFFSFFDRKVYDLKWKYSLRHADKIIAVSSHTKKDLIQMYDIKPDKIEVIYPFIDDAFWSPNIQRPPDLPTEYYLSVGVSPRKNTLTLLKGYKNLPEELKLPLILVGAQNDYLAKIKKWIHQNHLEENILFIPFLEMELLVKVFAHAEIMIYPSCYEGFGAPVAEALLTKTPVITSGVSSLPEAGGPDSWYVDPKDALSITEGIQRIMTDHTLRRRMVDNGYSYAKKTFDTGILVRQMYDLYTQTLRNS